MRQTTVGWKFRVNWKDGTVTWTSLEDLKESNHIEVDKYVTTQIIQDDPNFSWWVPFTLRKRDRMITVVNYHIINNNNNNNNNNNLCCLECRASVSYKRM